MKTKRILALLLGVVLLSGSLLGCAKKDGETISQLPWAINEMDVEVIDDLPDWTGSTIDLSVWHAYGDSNNAIGRTKTDDKFQAEMTRVSGVSLSEKTSYDNAGGSADSKVAQMVSTKNYPHVAVGLDSSVTATLVEGDKLYALDEYIEKWMPNYTKYINYNETTKKTYDMQTKYDGKVYTLMQLGPNMVKHVDPEYTAEKYEDLMYVTSTRASFYVRDDILKKIHPEAHTVKELQEIYMKNGEFTDAEMTDFTVKSLDEFRKLLEDIAALNITEGDKKVWPIYTADGTDNWGLFAELLSFTGAGYGSPNSYFAYYDKATQKLANPFKQDWFKDFAKFWTDICQDGLASKEALIDTRAAFEQKVNNGEYAILYGTTVPPTDEVLQAGGKPYAYRKVFIDIPMDTERFVNISSENIFTNYGLCFFKDVMSEAELEQVLRLIDFSYTEAGMKFSAWGPKKSGLYAEDEKGFYYTDEAFEKAMISGGDNQVFFDYGYASFPVMTHFMGDVDKRNNNNYFNLYAPQIEYTKRDNERVPSEYSNAMNYAYIEPKPDNLVYLAKPWHIWLFTGEIEGVKTMWNARTAVEDAIKKVLTAQNDEEFEAFYAEVIELQEGYGYDDACFDEMTQWLEDKNGKEAMDALRNFQ